MRQVYASFRHRILNLDCFKLLSISLWHKTNSYVSFQHRILNHDCFKLLSISLWHRTNSYASLQHSALNPDCFLVLSPDICRTYQTHQILSGHNIKIYYQDMMYSYFIKTYVILLIYVGHTIQHIFYEDIVWLLLIYVGHT